jgi:hypothetical protein
MLLLPSARLSLLGFWMLLSGGVSASETIYQVEMVVFERRTPSGDEVWPKNLVLEYPQPWQRLFNPQQEAERQRAADQANSLRLSDEFLQTLAQESAQLQTGTDPDPTQASELSVPDPTTLPDFFAFLPADKRELQKTRDALDRNQQLRVLFHETWRQPLGAVEKSPALILQGGNQYGDRFELQGYIHLGISRFLHLHTNLWFTHFAPNHGQIPEHWPNLPKVPVGLSSDANVADTATGSAELSQRVPTSPESEDADVDLAQTPYIINQIVTLQQKRRLRNGELHYLDHPRLGILIKMTPQK